MNTVKCAHCGLVNFASDAACKRCGRATRRDRDPDAQADASAASRIPEMALRIGGITLLLLFLWHVSITLTSESASFDQLQAIKRATAVIERQGFAANGFILRYLVRYRASDSWWNNWVGHETAYAATNFPFEVVTLYKEFYETPVDDTERAAILLHESYHLLGYGEPGAFEKVWLNKEQLGWTEERYGHTRVWLTVREATGRHAPHLFICGADGKGVVRLAKSWAGSANKYSQQSPPHFGSDDQHGKRSGEVLASLASISLPEWQTRRDALSARFERARKDAEKLAEPTAIRVTLPSMTLRTELEVDEWLAKERSRQKPARSAVGSGSSQ